MIKDMSFVIPFYDWWNSPLYGLGLKVYDMMAGKLGLGPSELLDKQETMSLINNVNKVGLETNHVSINGRSTTNIEIHNLPVRRSM